MDDVIEVENYVDEACVRHVHWMSNDPLRLKPLSPKYGLSPDLGEVKPVREAGVWHLRWTGPYRGVIDIPAACAEGRFRRLVAWNLEGCESVRVALRDAAREYARLFGGRAEFGFMKRLPRGVEHGDPVGDLILLEAEWMLERCVAVGGGGG